MTFAPAPRPGSAGPPPPRPQRPLWHWLLLGGAGMALLLVALIVALILLWQILGRGDPETTLDDFYDSLQTSDCALFEETTTPEYRDATRSEEHTSELQSRGHLVCRHLLEK